MAMGYNKNNFNLFDKSLETIMNNLPLKYDNNERRYNRRKILYN